MPPPDVPYPQSVSEPIHGTVATGPKCAPVYFLACNYCGSVSIMNGVRSDADALTRSLTMLRHALLRDGFLDAVRTMADHDISVAQLATLMLLDAEGSVTVGDLANDLARSLSATSRLVDQLVQRGIASRREDDRDRRVKRITLTEHGKELIGRVQRRRAEAQLAVMEALTDGERTEVMRAMALLAEAAARRRDAERLVTPT
jgi:DNA-binding MarR family transcriptional regulator